MILSNSAHSRMGYLLQKRKRAPILGARKKAKPEKPSGSRFEYHELENFQKKVKMADNLGPMAWLFLPENMQVQYLQKIAQCAKNAIRPQMVSLFGLALFSARSAIFCCH